MQDRPSDQFVVFAQNHDQVGNRAFGDRLPAEARPLAALCVAAVPVHADAVHGRGVRRDRPVPVLHRPHRPDIAAATREGRRREFARVRRVRRRGARPAGPGDLRALEADAACADHDLAELYRRLLRVRRELPAQSVPIAWDEDARWLAVQRGDYTLVASFADTAQSVPCDGLEVVVATHGLTADDLDPANATIHLPPRAGALVAMTR